MQYSELVSRIRVFIMGDYLGFVYFCTPPPGRELLMRNFNSQEGVFKPILRIKITPEELSILDSGRKNVQSRDYSSNIC